jgi:hypothetical protein
VHLIKLSEGHQKIYFAEVTVPLIFGKGWAFRQSYYIVKFFIFAIAASNVKIKGTKISFNPFSTK